MLTDLPREIKSVRGGTQIVFPANQTSDYHFEGFVSTDEEFLEINAILNETWQRTFPGHNYFWHMTFEIVGSDVPSEVWSSWSKAIWRLVTHKTKICQIRGVLCWSFICYVFEEERWHRIFGNSAFRYSNFKPPQITQRKQWYQATEFRENQVRP